MRAAVAMAVLVLAAATNAALLRSRGEMFEAAAGRKMRNGPPSEFASKAVPPASAGAIYDNDAIYYVALGAQPSASGAGWTYERDIALDPTSNFAFAVVLPNGAVPDSIQLLSPEGKALDLDAAASQGYWPVGDDGPLSGQPLQTLYSFPDPEHGLYKLSFSVSSTQLTGSINDGVVFTWVDSEDEIFSSLNSYSGSMRVQDNLGVVARMYQTSANPSLRANPGLVPKAVPDVVTKASLVTVLPDGTLTVTPLHDDGLHNDGDANDGVYAGSIVPTVTGAYTLQTVLEGTHADGSPFYRSAEHPVEVVPHDLDLTGKVTSKVDLANNRVVFNIGVVEDSSTDYEGAYIAYTQVWGQSLAGKGLVPIAYAQARVDPVTSADNADAILSLDVDMRWLLQAGAVGPFTLKDVQVHEVNTMALVATADTLSVSHTDDVARAINTTFLQLAKQGYNGEITEAMLMGPRPAKLLAMQANVTATGHKLVLVHGYCTERNPFLDAYDWTDGIFFLDAKASRSNDVFSQLVLQFIQTTGGNPSSYSMVGHSQGGMVQVHLYEFYWTGIDNAGKGRKIQSLATPYQGASGTGALNAIGGLVGSCGDNQDLSRDGAVAWLPKISANTRKEMYYYTTQGSPKKCSGLTSMFMKSPNDGVTENIYATLDGGNFMGNTLGECHGYNFEYPPSFLNTARNKEFNDNSARP